MGDSHFATAERMNGINCGNVFEFILNIVECKIFYERVLDLSFIMNNCEDQILLFVKFI